MICFFLVLFGSNGEIEVRVREPIEQATGSLAGKYKQFEPNTPKSRLLVRQECCAALEFLEKTHELSFFVNQKQLKITHGGREHCHDFPQEIDSEMIRDHEQKFVELACALSRFVQGYKYTKKAKGGKVIVLTKVTPLFSAFGGIASAVLAGKVSFQDAAICSIGTCVMVGTLQFFSDYLSAEMSEARRKGQESDCVIEGILKFYTENDTITRALCDIIPFVVGYEDPRGLRKHLPGSWHGGLHVGRDVAYAFQERTDEEKRQQNAAYKYLKDNFGLEIQDDSVLLSERHLTIKIRYRDIFGDPKILSKTSDLVIPRGEGQQSTNDDIIKEQLQGFFYALYLYLAHYHDVRHAYESRNDFCKKMNQLVIWIGNVASSILVTSDHDLASYVAILAVSFVNLIGHIITTFYYESKIQQAYSHRVLADERLAQFLSFFKDMPEIRELLVRIIHDTTRHRTGTDCQNKLPAAWDAGLRFLYVGEKK